MGISNKVMPKKGDEIIGEYGTYILKDKLGNGGNGTVFDIEIIGTNRELPLYEDGYVIKILTINETRNKEEREKRRQRFQREVRAVRQLESLKLDIIPIIDSYMGKTDPDCEWYMMPKAKEYRYNGFAQSVIKLRQLRSLGETISLLHKNGVFHRDIKPANLLFYKNKCCLTDFGLVWSVNETDHITGANEVLGPVGIRPPEMEFNVDKLKEEIDFQKVDVYLFAKTIWILLTGNRNGFRGAYRRGDKSLYLDNTRLRLGRTIEPLHRMMEAATVYENKKRITIEKCLEYLEQQIAIADGSMLTDFVETLRFKEIMNEAKTQIESDAVVFEKPEKIHVALSKMEKVVELFADDCGKEISLGTLVRVAVASDNIFEINLKKDFVIAGQKRKRKIFLNISKMEIKKENIVEISTDYLKGLSVSEKNVKDIASMVNFQGDTVGVDGKYIFIFRSK